MVVVNLLSDMEGEEDKQQQQQRENDDAAAEQQQEEGPPRPPPEALEDEPDVGPAPPKAKKRKVRIQPRRIGTACRSVGGGVARKVAAGADALRATLLLLARRPSSTLPPPPQTHKHTNTHANFKTQVLPFEQQYLDALPCAAMYEKSYMHRDTLTCVVATSSDFIITGSADGHLKFWKKQEGGIEFVKHYRAHLGSVDGERGRERGGFIPAVLLLRTGRRVVCVASCVLRFAEQTMPQNPCTLAPFHNTPPPASLPHSQPAPQASPPATTARCAPRSAGTAPPRCSTSSRLT